jgi:hypothetical protein
MRVGEIARLAASVDTRVGGEMLRACAVWADSNGERVDVPPDRLGRAVAARFWPSEVDADEVDEYMRRQGEYARSAG